MSDSISIIGGALNQVRLNLEGDSRDVSLMSIGSFLLLLCHPFVSGRGFLDQPPGETQR